MTHDEDTNSACASFWRGRLFVKKLLFFTYRFSNLRSNEMDVNYKNVMKATISVANLVCMPAAALVFLLYHSLEIYWRKLPHAVSHGSELAGLAVMHRLIHSALMSFPRPSLSSLRSFITFDEGQTLPPPSFLLLHSHLT